MLAKVNTLSACAYAHADQCICYRVSCTVCLLVGECSCLCVATVYVRLFIVSLRTIKEKKNKFVSYYLFTMCKFQLITTNINMKIRTNSPGCLQQRRGSDCTAAQSDACLYPARHGSHFDGRFLITKHLIIFNHFRLPY